MFAGYERVARNPNPDNLTAIRSAFEVAGIQFSDSNGGGPSVRFLK